MYILGDICLIDERMNGNILSLWKGHEGSILQVKIKIIMKNI